MRVVKNNDDSSEIAKLSASLSNANEGRKKSNGEVVKLKQRLAEISSEAQQKMTELKEATTKLNKLQVAKEKVDGKLSTVEADKEVLQKRIGESESSESATSDKLGTAVSSLSEVRAAKVKLEKDMETVQKKKKLLQEKFMATTDELKSTKSTLFLAQSDGKAASSALGSIQTELKATKSRLSAATATVEAKAGDLDEARRSLITTQGRVTDLEKEIEAARVNTDNALDNNQKLRAEVSGLEETLDASKTMYTELQSEFEKATEKAKEVAEKQAKKAEQLHAHSKRTEEMLSTVEASLLERESILADTSTSLESKIEECNGLSMTVASLTHDKASLTEDVAASVSECGMLEAKLAKLESVLKERGKISNEELEDLREKVNTVVGTLAETQQELTDTNTEFAAKQAELSTLRDILKTAQDHGDELGVQVQHLQGILETATSEVSELTAAAAEANRAKSNVIEKFDNVSIELETSKGNVRKLSGKMEEGATKIAELKNELKTTTTQSAAQINELTANLKSVTDKTLELDRDRDVLVSQLEESRGLLHSTKESSEARASTFKHQVSAMKFELSRTKIALKESQAENQASSENYASNAEEIAAKALKYETENSTLKADLAANVEQLGSLQGTHASTEKSVSMLSESLETARKDHANALASLQDVEARLQTTMLALGSAEQLAQELQEDLIAKTMQKAQMWKHTDALETAVRKSATTWVIDDDAQECSRCDEDFSFTRRKHHCRACGNVFCGACAYKTRMLAAHKEPQRVCIGCDATLTTLAAISV